MTRRGALAALGTAAASLGGYGALRVGDYRPYAVDERVPDGSPAERIVAASRKLRSLDHRAVTHVTVLAEGDADVEYPSARYRRIHEHSRRRHLAAYTTFRVPAGAPGPTASGLLARIHRSYAANDSSSPRTSVIHASDGTVLADWDAPTPETPDDPPGFDGADAYRSANRHGARGFGDHLLAEPAEWRRGSAADGGVPYLLAGPEAYTRVVPLLTAVEVHEGSALLASLDAETGVLRRLVDRRIVTERVDDGEGGSTTRRFRYRIETTFDRYGEATAPRPAGAPWAKPTGYLRELALDLGQY